MSQKFVSESTGHGQYFLNDVWQGKRAMSDREVSRTGNTQTEIVAKALEAYLCR